MQTRSCFRRLRLAAFALVASVAFVAFACQKQAPSSESRETAALAVPSPSAETAPAAPSASLAKPAPAAEMPFGGQDQSVGKFVETSAYKFKVDGVLRCKDPAPTETVPEDRKVRVAAKVGVLSKYDSFFVSAQDVTLEKDGVVINSERKLKTTAECAPLLEQQHLNHDQSAQGYVVFQVPDEAFVRGGIVAFKPTRWGGGPRTEIKIDAKDFAAGATSAAPATK